MLTRALACGLAAVVAVLVGRELTHRRALDAAWAHADQLHNVTDLSSYARRGAS